MINEAVLYRQIGGAAVVQAQLSRVRGQRMAVRDCKDPETCFRLSPPGYDRVNRPQRTGGARGAGRSHPPVPGRLSVDVLETGGLDGKCP